ncbi:MAG: PhoH family protein [Pseudomonadota bacterium]|nr:PhoH family protein [Pseudomonadota bacterium]
MTPQLYKPELNSLNLFQQLCGPNSEHLTIIEKKFAVTIEIIGNQLCIHGKKKQVLSAIASIDILCNTLNEGITLSHEQVSRILSNSSQNRGYHTIITVYSKTFKLANPQQALLHQRIQQHDITFAIGPAGTGKTFVTVLSALYLLANQTIKKIILTRPAVDAGEKLGFLPGDLSEKVDPYLRPYYDELHHIIGIDSTQELIDRKIIEIAPIAFMRGRTFSKACIIADEAQNLTLSQMKMLLTRIGHHSKIIVSGDITQSDLCGTQTSGLAHAKRTLQHIPEVSFTYFATTENVRNPLISKILYAYDQDLKKS